MMNGPSSILYYASHLFHSMVILFRRLLNRSLKLFADGGIQPDQSLHTIKIVRKLRLDWLRGCEQSKGSIE